MREELRECAWLLSLLNSQQQAILSRSVDSLNEVSQSIEDQAVTVSSRAAQRTLLSEKMLTDLGHQGDGPESLIRLAPPSMQALFVALQEEGSSLREKLQRRSRQNERLLKRAQALGKELLENFEPSGERRSYTRSGNLKKPSALSGSVIRTSV